MSDKTLTIVFGEDRTERLHPLTEDRVKSALPFGGEYRVVDFVLTNCLHSGLRRILVLAGGLSHSLYAHLRAGWSVFNPALGEFINPLPTPTPESPTMSESAVALRAAITQIERSRATNVVLLDGGFVYRMDYAAMLEAHEASGADATFATIDPHLAGNSARPIVTCDGDRITGVTPSAANGASDTGAPKLLGAYVIKAAVLLALLREIPEDDTTDDFASAILTPLIAGGSALAYSFGGAEGRVSQDRFWAELASIDAYFDAQIALLEPIPPIDLYQTDWPVWSRSSSEPPVRTVESASGNEGLFVNSIVSNGTVIAGGAVSRSVLGRRVRVQDHAVVERAILLDDVVIGDGASLRNCIVGKRAVIAPGDEIGVDRQSDAERFSVTASGLVVVPSEYGT